MPLEVFYSYSHKDSALRDELQVHLKQLERDGLIAGWADRRLAGGDEWRSAIDEHVRSAKIILLLVSPDFLASDYCYGVELTIAMQRHARKEAVVIPIILRPSDWQSTPFAELQALPRDGKAVTLWPDRDEVLAQIALSLREVVTPLQAPATGPQSDFASLFERQAVQSRVLDAAMPSHIVKDKATELLALIRLPQSQGLAGVLQQDEEADARPEDVRSKAFDVTFQLGPTGLPQPLRVTVQLTSPDFTPASQMKKIFVPVNGDSPVCAFLLTPIRSGALLVVIELLWEEAERGYRRLRTNCVSEAALPEQSVMNMVRMEVVTGFGSAMPTAVGAVASAPQRHSPGEFAESYGSVGASMTQMLKPAAAARPLPPLPMPREAMKSSRFLSGSLVRAALALFVVAMGSTFFFVRNPAMRAPSQPPDAVTPSAPVLEQRLQSATIELEQAQKVDRSPPSVPDGARPEDADAAAMRESEQNLAAARMALQKGDRVEARKRLSRAETLNRRLSYYAGKK